MSGADIPPEGKEPVSRPRPLAQVLPDTLAWEHRAIPLGWQEERLTVGIVPPDKGDEPADTSAIAAAAGAEIVVVPIVAENFERMFASLYPKSVFVSAALRSVPRQAGPIERLVKIWEDSPLQEVTDLLNWVVLAALAISVFMLFGWFAIGSFVAMLHLLLSPAVLGLLVVGLGLTVYRLTTRKGRPDA